MAAAVGSGGGCSSSDAKPQHVLGETLAVMREHAFGVATTVQDQEERRGVRRASAGWAVLPAMALR
jgi:hypothetical protein